MKKLLKTMTTLAIVATLSACSSTPDLALENASFTNEKDEVFKPNLTEYSMAYNIAMSARKPDKLKDADVPQEAWDDISATSHTVSAIAGFMAGGLGSALSFSMDSLVADSVGNFNDPMVSLWVEVDALNDYGSDEFKELVFKKAHTQYLSTLVGKERLSEPKYADLSKWSYGANLDKELCDKRDELANVKVKVKSCLAGSNVMIIRPVPVGAWIPEMIQVDRTKQHVQVSIIFTASVYTLTPNMFENGITYIPSSFKFTILDEQGNLKHYKRGVGYPYYQYKNTRYLFVEPNDDGTQIGTITLSE